MSGIFEPGAATRAGSQSGTSTRRELAEVTVILLSLGLLIGGAFGSLVSDNRWVEVVGNHLGGLGLVGLLASQAGFIARKKGRDYRMAFLVGSVLPIALGALAVVLVFFLKGFVYCGGGVVLLSAILVAVGCCCLRRRTTTSG